MLQGFLQFKREIKFQKRWFVLKGNMLFYFDKKGDKEPLGLLLLEGCELQSLKIFDFRIWKFNSRHRRTVWWWRFSALLLPARFPRREQSNILLGRSLTERDGVVDEKFNLCNFLIPTIRWLIHWRSSLLGELRLHEAYGVWVAATVGRNRQQKQRSHLQKRHRPTEGTATAATEPVQQTHKLKLTGVR